MPLYDYRCQLCGETFEVIQKFSDDPLRVHEGCGGQVERLISPPAFQFKGSGWYVTDYARGNKGSSSTPDSGDSKAESKTETKSDSKPAATPTSKEK